MKTKIIPIPRLILLSIAALLTGGAAAVRGQSALDGFDPNANDGQVRAIAVQPDGKILIGGYFTVIAGAERKYIARLNPDGTLDMDFNPRADSGVLAIAVQADGQILAGGFFGNIGGLPRNFIARLDATTGAADRSFDPNPEAFVSSIAVQADRQILVGGFFTRFTPNRMGQGVLRNYIARLDSTGSTAGMPDAFDPNPDAYVTSVVAIPGRIFVGGFFTSFARSGSQPVIRNHIAGLYPNGRVESGFNPNALGGIVNAIAVQADGQVLIGGSFTNLAPPHGKMFERNCIARVDSTFGFADPSFDPHAEGGNVGSLAVQPDGKILMGGNFTSLLPPGGPEVALHRIARLKPDGTPEISFNPNVPNTNDYVYSIAVQADGKILTGGIFTTLAPNFGPAVTRNNIARLETDGRLDRTLDAPLFYGEGRIEMATAVQPDGKILIGGYFSTVSGEERFGIARLNTDGTLDMDFYPGASSVSSIAVQRDRQILIGGNFKWIVPTGGQEETRLHMARLSPSGLLDPFNPSANDLVNAIVVQADDRILVAGVFNGLNSIGGTSTLIPNRLARLEPGGTLDTTCDPDANDVVNSIAVLADNRIVAGGAFNGMNSIGGMSDLTRYYLARLAPTGTLNAPSFNPNPDAPVFSIAIQADGQVLAGGNFARIGGLQRNHIARLSDPFGAADPSFNPDADGSVVSVSLQADGQIVAGGYFTNFRPPGTQFPTIRKYIARLNPDGTLYNPFNPDANRVVRSIALQSDGKILVGGDFDNISGQPRSGFARLSNRTAALQNLDVTRSDTALNTITWTRGGSSPELTRATFELSTNGGATYTFLGDGVRVGTTSNFALTGLILPIAQNFWIRARGHYRSGQFNGSESITESVRNAFIPSTSIVIGGGGFQNFSTRFRVQTGDNAGIGGFIITGTEPKHVLLRAIGPSLAQFGVADALADPVLELHGPDAFVTITNNNWRDRQETGILATGIPPPNDLEAAIDATLDPGAYTALLTGNGNTSGVALVEVYDLDRTVDSKLANISTRAFVSTGDNIVIAGFMLGEGKGNNGWIVVRGIGPSLAAFGVTGALADPTLELRDSNGALLISNNDWQDNPEQAAALTAMGLAPTNDFESGIAATLPPGPYTALLAGQNNSTGVGVVEVYGLGVL